MRNAGMFLVATGVLALGCGATDSPTAGAGALFGSGEDAVTDTIADAVTDAPGAAEGCSHGFWMNHPQAWPPTGLSPTGALASVFTGAAGFPSTAEATLLDALRFPGGPGEEGAARILLRAATAALLNASDPGLSFPFPAWALADIVNQVLAMDRARMLIVAERLAAMNDAGCPQDD